MKFSHFYNSVLESDKEKEIEDLLDVDHM